MSTPRTDAELERMKAASCPGIVCGDFAQRLELENKELLESEHRLEEENTTAQLKHAREDFDRLKGECK